MTAYRFDGAIAGIGTASGVRLVAGLWPRSPYGPIADVMIERPDGHRILVAPTGEVAGFIAATYSFDEVRVQPTQLRLAGRRFRVTSPSLDLAFDVGGRTALGQVLVTVPPPLARARWWAHLLDPVASRVRPGVRTIGTAGGGRREYFAALDEHRLVAVHATLDDEPLGALRDVDPPVRFGFASTPPRPSLVRVTSTVFLPRAAAS